MLHLEVSNQGNEGREIATAAEENEACPVPLYTGCGEGKGTRENLGGSGLRKGLNCSLMCPPSSHPPASQEQAGAHASTDGPTPSLFHTRAHFLAFQRNLPTSSTFYSCQEVSERETSYISDLAQTRMHSICFVTGQKWKLLPQGRNIKQRQNMIASSGEACMALMSLLPLASS